MESRAPLGLVAGYWAAAWLVGSIGVSVLVAVDGSETLAERSITLIFAGALVGWTAYAVVLWRLSERFGPDAIGWASPQWRSPAWWRWSDLAGIPVGVLAQLIVLPVLYWPLRELWPSVFNDESLNETAEQLVDRASGGAIVILVVMVVIGAPLVEEFVYRGMIQRSLIGELGSVMGVIAASAWFALIHFRPIEYPGLFVIGLILGACAVVTGRLTTSILAHLAFNATALVMVGR